MKESDFDWDDLGSHDGLGDPLQPDLRRMAVAVGFDEAEAANMLVSLGTSRSGTPVFSPGTSISMPHLSNVATQSGDPRLGDVQIDV